ncbi:Protein of unknown function [Lactobacillus equicursoris 66c]|uniref:Uncharacterized protein n=1 Tax=Lactobacillus equicursoris 66c TaxID=872326 RepID=K0NEL2_9LACO|nr:Protein of unknown function [Lactobacillus equicursoris 66c]
MIFQEIFNGIKIKSYYLPGKYASYDNEAVKRVAFGGMVSHDQWVQQ